MSGGHHLKPKVKAQNMSLTVSPFTDLSVNPIKIKCAEPKVACQIFSHVLIIPNASHSFSTSGGSIFELQQEASLKEQILK